MEIFIPDFALIDLSGHFYKKFISDRPSTVIWIGAFALIVIYGDFYNRFCIERPVQ